MSDIGSKLWTEHALPLKKKDRCLNIHVSFFLGNKWRVLVIQNKTESQTGSQVVSCKVNV